MLRRYLRPEPRNAKFRVATGNQNIDDFAWVNFPTSGSVDISPADQYDAHDQIETYGYAKTTIAVRYNGGGTWRMSGQKPINSTWTITDGSGVTTKLFTWTMTTDPGDPTSPVETGTTTFDLPGPLGTITIRANFQNWHTGLFEPI